MVIDASPAAGWSEAVASGQMPVEVWHQRMRDEIRRNYIQQYLAGRGGLEKMTAVDWGSVGGMIAEQYRWLDNFAAQIAAGELSAAQIRVRAQMYINSSREAYERASAQPPDFLITDLQMPAMSGLELCARLTAELPEPIPTILLTAKGFEIDPNAIGGLPILHVMTKPFSPRELLANVQAALAVGAAS